MYKYRVLTLALTMALLTSPSHAAEIDRYLPADTEVVQIVNVRQLLGSALVKRIGVDKIRDLIKQSEEATEVLKDLKLDPLKDVDRIITAGPSVGEQDKGLTIIQGRFDVEAWRARAAKEAKDKKETVKIQKIKDGQGGEHTIYELNLSDVVPGLPVGQAVYVGFASKNVILIGASKDYLIDGLKVKPDATKAQLKNKALADMLSRLDEKQSLSIALIGEALTKGELANAPDAVKDVLKTITAGSGGLTVTDGIKLELMVSTKEEADAKKIKETVNNGIKAALGFAALAAMQQKELDALVEFLKKINISSREKSVSLKAELSGEDLDKLIPKDQ
jgi:hypothetical protein